MTRFRTFILGAASTLTCLILWSILLFLDSDSSAWQLAALWATVTGIVGLAALAAALANDWSE